MSFGSPIPFCEPYWYQGFASPYYTDAHREYRARMRKFVDEEVIPNVEQWIKIGYPMTLHSRCHELGLSGVLYPKKFGGKKEKDYFYELIFWDELQRQGGGYVLNQLAINTMTLPPIIEHGSEYLQNLVCKDVVTGKKCICLAISEPGAGSDVASITTTAVKDGDEYVISGSKKWITGSFT